MKTIPKGRILTKIGCVLTLAWVVGAGASVASEAGVRVYESEATPVPAGHLDELVFANLAKLGVQPVLCSDAVFVRRAFLDTIGKLPTAAEAREFIRDPDTANKRRILIDRLLARPEFADYWAMRWGDTLRIKAEFPVNLWPNAAQAYHHWVRAAVATNMPYDRFARELLTSSGSNFRVGPTNFYRAIQNRNPEGIATAVALTLMGARTDKWPPERLAGMAVFFSQIGYKPTNEWKEEHVFWDPLGTSTLPGNTAPGRAAIAPPPPPKPATPAAPPAKPAAPQKSATPAKPAPSAKPTPPQKSAPPPKPAAPTASPAVSPAPPPPAAPALPAKRGPQVAVFPDGTRIELPPDRDPREVFAAWLITPDNPWFARNAVNRVWAWLLGRGIVHEPDDIRDDNPPGQPALLDWLAGEFVAGHYDLQRLYRTILNSRTYQLSCLPPGDQPVAAAAFASYPLRRLDAEVLIDALNQITGTTDLYTSPIPEPFTYIPPDQTAVAIADGSITSTFLALFGRSARATGMANERDNQPVPAQWLHLLNSSHIQQKLEQGPKLKKLLESGRKPPAIVEELYLTILSRFPTPEEMQLAASLGRVEPVKPAAIAAARKAGKPAPKPVVVKRREDWIDLAWALLNSTEFLYRH